MAEKVDAGSAASSEMVDLNAVSVSQLVDSSDSRGPSEDQLSVVTELSAFAIPQPDTVSLSMSMITDDAYSVLQSTYVSPKESEIIEEEGEESEKKDFLSEAEEIDEFEIEGEELTEEKSGLEEKFDETTTIEEQSEQEYTNIDVIELNAMGEEVTVKKLVPKIKEETFVKKKMMPITVKFNRIGDGDELIEEEETVEEEMSFMVTRMTVLVKQLNDKGEEVLVEKVIENEVLIEEKPKKKKIIIRKTLPSGEEIDEEIEIEEQEKSISRKGSELSAKYEEEFFDEQEGIWEYEDYTQEFIDEGGEARHIKSKRRIWKPKYKEPPINAIIEDEKQLKSELLEELKKVRSKLKLYRQKNKFLGKKLCQFYKIKRKDIKEEAQRLLPETEAILRRQYHRRLLEYNEVRQFLLTEMETRSHILKEAKNTSEQLKTELDSRINSFFEQQREILKKLDPKVVKIVLRNVDFEKVLDQQLKMDRMLSDVRRDYVRKMYQFTELKEKHAMRKRTKPSDRENDIDIVTYEQLKVATRDLQDTLDMKESYIQKLKETLVHAVQTLAHVRFKREAIDQSLENINKEMVDAKRELAELRNECRTIREKRFKVMKEVKKFNDKSGLLKYPLLVKDYYEITDDKMFLDEELIKVKMTVDNQKMLLEDVKKKRRAQNRLKK